LLIDHRLFLQKKIKMIFAWGLEKSSFFFALSMCKKRQTAKNSVQKRKKYVRERRIAAEAKSGEKQLIFAFSSAMWILPEEPFPCIFVFVRKEHQ